jgi:hypothetical protein
MEQRSAPQSYSQSTNTAHLLFHRSDQFTGQNGRDSPCCVPMQSSSGGFLLRCKNHLLLILLLQSRRMELFIQPHQVALQHGDRHLSDQGNVDDTRDFQQFFFVDIFEGRDIDDSRMGLDPFRGQSIGFGGDTRDNHRRLS